MLCLLAAWTGASSPVPLHVAGGLSQKPLGVPSGTQRPPACPRPPSFRALQGRECPAHQGATENPAPDAVPCTPRQRPDSSPRMLLSEITTYFSLLKTIWWLPISFKVNPQCFPWWVSRQLPSGPRPPGAHLQWNEACEFAPRGGPRAASSEGVSKDLQDPVLGDPRGEGQGSR